MLDIGNSGSSTYFVSLAYLGCAVNKC